MIKSNFCFIESQDIIANCNYPTACTSITISKDQTRMITLGIYKPSIKVFDLENLTIKFERHLITDGIKSVVLTDNGEKFAVLRKSRSIEFHSRNGLHETVKLPYQPKDIEFNACKSELYMCGNYESIYRFNLVQGRFLRGIDVDRMTKIVFSETNGLLLGMKDNYLNFIDTRSNETVLNKCMDNELKCIDINKNGLFYAIGSENGYVYEFDMRMNNILKEEKIQDCISKVKYCENELFVACDNKITNFHFNSSVFEMDYEINDFYVSNKFLFIGGENKEIAFFKNELKNKLND